MADRADHARDRGIGNEVADERGNADFDERRVGTGRVHTDAHGVEVRPVSTTNHEPHADVFLDGAVVSADDRLGPAGDGGQLVGSLYTRALVGLCAIQLGVSERALRTCREIGPARSNY